MLRKQNQGRESGAEYAPKVIRAIRGKAIYTRQKVLPIGHRVRHVCFTNL